MARSVLGGALLSLVTILALGACGSNRGNSGPPECIPGATQACFDQNGCLGAQVCAADGKSLGICECGSTSDAGEGDATLSAQSNTAADGAGEVGLGMGPGMGPGVGAGGDDASRTMGPVGPSIPNYPVRELHHDAPYIDSNADFLFEVQSQSPTWGVLGLTQPTATSDFGIDLYAQDGTLLATSTRYWDCGADASPSPNETGFIALNGARFPSGSTFYAVAHTAGGQYTVEWYQATVDIPFSRGLGCSASDWGCAPFPTGHVAHAYDVAFAPANNYALYHSDSCGCPGVTSGQTFQFVVESNSATAFASSNQYVSVAPTCSTCGSDQVGVTVDPGADSNVGVIAIDTTGQSHAAVNICYQATAQICAPPLTLCSPVCTDTTSDPQDCGSTCTDCTMTVSNATGSGCTASVCTYGSCDPGYFDCDGNRANGCEVSQAVKCARVQNVTGVSFTCAGGCDYASCDPGYYDCDGNRADGCEVSSAVDCTGIQHASVTFTCAGGCGYSACNTGYLDCDGNPANGCEYLGVSCPVTLATGNNLPSGIAVDSTWVYWANYGDGRVMKVAIAGGTPVTVASGQRTPYGVAVDSTYVYWTNFGVGMVMKAPISGGTPMTLASGQGSPFQLAVDSNSVYWTNYNGGTVASVALGGGAVVTLASGQSKPYGIGLDGGTVYWTTAGGGTVSSVPIGGGTVTTLVSGQTAGPMALAINGTSMYWESGTSLMSAPLSGGTPMTLGPAAAYGSCSGIGVDGTWVYTTLCNSGLLSRVPVGGGTTVTFASTVFGQSNIALDSTSVYWTTNSAIMKAAK
jgi:hypothetical protein